jgi:hypothetical protein
MFPGSRPAGRRFGLIGGEWAHGPPPMPIGIALTGNKGTAPACLETGFAPKENEAACAIALHLSIYENLSLDGWNQPLGTRNVPFQDKKRGPLTIQLSTGMNNQCSHFNGNE